MSTDPTRKHIMTNIVTVDITTDYTPQIQVGTEIFSKSGFKIGTVVGLVDEIPGRD